MKTGPEYASCLPFSQRSADMISCVFTVFTDKNKQLRCTCFHRIVGNMFVFPGCICHKKVQMTAR